MESRLRSSKSATPPIKGHTPSPELYERQRLTAVPHHKQNQRGMAVHGHAPVVMSKSVSPPKATPPRYLSATNSDASTSLLQTQNQQRSTQPSPNLDAPSTPPTRVPVQPCESVSVASLEKSKMLGHLQQLSTSDKDSSYVKFPRRMDPAHEYSYPKLIDAYKDNKKKPSPPPAPPPLPIGLSGLDKASSGSSSGSSSSKKSRPSLPSLVLSCGGGVSRSIGGVAIEDNESSHTSLSPLGLSSSLQATAETSTTLNTLICAHCRKSYNPASNGKGACRYAPRDWARTTVETVTCLSCARCLLYHCISDPDEDEEAHPCECTPNGGGVRRWLGLTLLSILVPCLCCYPPLIACYKGAAACRLCGGRHEASKAQLF